MSAKHSFYRHYLQLHYWLREQCDRLSLKARKRLVYGISVAYLLCSLAMIAQFFLPKEEEPRIPIPEGQLIDAPIQTKGLDSLGNRFSEITYQMIHNYG
ncbi:MAG: hypothetical protein Q4A61_06250 [Porphyromonadaceae bacterium]|nr:hypothetical protein [Porphyromonadaceae bacterium]